MVMTRDHQGVVLRFLSRLSFLECVDIFSEEEDAFVFVGVEK